MTWRSSRPIPKSSMCPIIIPTRPTVTGCGLIILLMTIPRRVLVIGLIRTLESNLEWVWARESDTADRDWDWDWDWDSAGWDCGQALAFSPC